MSTAKVAKTAAGDDVPGEDISPIVVDIGRKKKKQIKNLCNGEGKLMAQVEDVISELRSAGTIKGEVQPVVIVVKQRDKRQRGLLLR